MKLVRFDGGRTGILAGGVVVDASDVVTGPSWAPLIADWASAREALADRERRASAEGVPLGDVGLEAPLPDPAARIFAMGGNFPMHTAATVEKLDMEISDSVKSGAKEDTPPWGFYVIPGTIVGPEAQVTPPRGTQKLDYEAEVGVILTGDPPGDGDVPIWGWTAWNDFSIRDPAFGLSKVDHGPLTWSLQKNFATANACGPCVVVDEPIPSAGLRIVCRVNGEVRQDGNTVDMKYGFDEIAAHIAEYLPLGAGDMILSGTPAGTGMEGGPDGPFLADGDVTEVEVDGVGVLRNRVVLGG